MQKWNYSVTLHGNVPYRCTLELEPQRLIWHAEPEDHEEDSILDCAQGLTDFREFGPPETPTAQQIPPEILDALCYAINLSDPDWRKPLPKETEEWFAAVDGDDRPKLYVALTNGMDINTLDRQHRTALWHAAAERGISLSEWLLERKADPNIPDRYGRTLLMDVAISSDVEKAELYVRYGADKAAVDSQGRTPYLVAVEMRARGALIRALAKYSPEQWDRALHIAAWGSNHEWLDDNGWYADAHHPDLNTVRSGRTPLQSCLEGLGPTPYAARWLVEHGADVTVAEVESRTTILHLAARENMAWLVTACVRQGVDVNARRRDGETALSLALDRNERPLLLRALLQAGAEPEDSIRAKAARKGLGWSRWMLDNPRATWTGFVCYAVVAPSGKEPETAPEETDAIWLEFPAEWHRDPDLSAKLIKAAGLPVDPAGHVRFLSWDEAKKHPWSWPGRKLRAVFPDDTVQLVERFRDERPPEMMGDPMAFQSEALERIEREWKWQGRSWAGDREDFSVRIQNGLVTWRGYNYRHEMLIPLFHIVGPPYGGGADRSVPREAVDELCASIGDWKREWEVPSSNEARKQREEEWKAAQPEPIDEKEIPEMAPHQSALWCYARANIEDHFHTSSGAGSDGKWACWLEFPAEWCSVLRPYREHWLRLALKRAYQAMNAKSEGVPGGGTYVLERALFTVLSLAEAKLQPWREKGKVLYLVTDRPLPPKSAADDEKLRPIHDMADPASAPSPIPISPPPYRGRR